MDPVAALALGVGAFALLLLFKQQQAAPPSMPAPAPSTGLPTSPVALLTTAMLNPQRINTAITGIDPNKTFQTFGDATDFSKLASNMNATYKAGNNAAAIAVQQQTGGTVLNCQPRGNNGGHIDCDANPVDLGNGRFTYRTADGQTHTGSYGHKVPVGGCAPWPTLSDGYNNASAVASNIAAGDCCADCMSASGGHI